MNSRKVIPAVLAALFLTMSGLATGQEETGEGEGEVPVGKVVWLGSPDQAAAVASKEGKLIIVEMDAPWSKWAKKLRDETFPDSGVQALLQKLVPLRIDPQKNDFARSLMHKAGARRFPVTLIVDSEWNVILLIPGYLPPDSFMADLKKALDPFEVYRSLEAKVVAGEAEYVDLYRYVEACTALKKTAVVREVGGKLLAMEKGEHHADVAYFIYETFKAGEEEAEKYKKLALEYDPENTRGYFDEFIIDEALAILRSAGERDEKVARATAILEGRLGQEEPKVHLVKAQKMYGLLFQVAFRNGRGDMDKSMDLLQKGIACAPDTEDGKRMARILAQIESRGRSKPGDGDGEGR